MVRLKIVTISTIWCVHGSYPSLGSRLVPRCVRVILRFTGFIVTVYGVSRLCIIVVAERCWKFWSLERTTVRWIYIPVCGVGHSWITHVSAWHLSRTNFAIDAMRRFFSSCVSSSRSSSRPELVEGMIALRLNRRTFGPSVSRCSRAWGSTGRSLRLSESSGSCEVVEMLQLDRRLLDLPSRVPNAPVN